MLVTFFREWGVIFGGFRGVFGFVGIQMHIPGHGDHESEVIPISSPK